MLRVLALVAAFTIIFVLGVWIEMKRQGRELVKEAEGILYGNKPA